MFLSYSKPILSVFVKRERPAPAPRRVFNAPPISTVRQQATVVQAPQRPFQARTRPQPVNPIPAPPQRSISFQTPTPIRVPNPTPAPRRVFNAPPISTVRQQATVVQAPQRPFQAQAQPQPVNPIPAPPQRSISVQTPTPIRVPNPTPAPIQEPNLNPVLVPVQTPATIRVPNQISTVIRPQASFESLPTQAEPYEPKFKPFHPKSSSHSHRSSYYAAPAIRTTSGRYSSRTPSRRYSSRKKAAADPFSKLKAGVVDLIAGKIEGISRLLG
jgi:hypothetical protein